MRVELVVITMSGSQYVLYDDGAGPAFPSGALADGEAPAAAARRVVKAATGTDAPKLELADLRASPGALLLVFRALLTSEPQGRAVKVNRMELPERVGPLLGKDVEETIKTGLSYKLTRV